MNDPIGQSSTSSMHLLWTLKHYIFTQSLMSEVPSHSDLFWEFGAGWSLGLKTISFGVFLFVDDCLIAALSWINLKRPKRSNLKWP